MKEITFLKENHQKWLHFEQMLNAGKVVNPDDLAELFVQITDDLSYARTFYPGSGTERYLNKLAVQVHQQIYRNKKEKRGRIFLFWKYDLPETMRRNLMNLLWSFLIFTGAFLIGWLSSMKDEGFIRLILGDGYVDMTLANIESGDPAAVYKRPGQVDMFASIAFNNIRVAFFCIAAGFLTFLGTAYMLFNNGVMLGAFLYIFQKNGALSEAMHAIWIHGTIEISIIIVAGAAGMRLARSIYSPGPYPIGTSVMEGARDAMKIGLGLIPLFILAAFFEGFVTRMTYMNDIGREIIIFGSLAFILWYFVVYPMYVRRKANNLDVRIVVGGILVVIPGIALGMNFISPSPVGLRVMLFFFTLIVLGLATIIYSIVMRKYTDADIVIGKKEEQRDELLGNVRTSSMKAASDAASSS